MIVRLSAPTIVGFLVVESPLGLACAELIKGITTQHGLSDMELS